MPWNRSAADERRFRIISTIFVIVALLLGITLNLIHVPPPAVREEAVVPPHLAQVIMERKQIEIPKVEPPPAPPELPKLEEKKPEPEAPAKKEAPKPEAKPEPQQAPPPAAAPAVAEKPVSSQARIEAARQKAAQSGVLAMSDMLADLREAAPATTSSANKPAQELITSGQKESAKATSILVGKASKGSGGIDTSKFSRTTGGGADLGSRQVASVSSDIANLEASGGSGTTSNKAKSERSSGRSEDEITRIMQANYNAIYAIYQRALRSNPLLQGKVVFKIDIDPSGAVTECTIVSSELHDDELDHKLALKIKRINFGAKDVAPTSVNYPIEFLPS